MLTQSVMTKDFNIILGPPGTGKTSYCMDTLEKELKRTEPNRIAFCSFTKKSVEEAKERAMSRFGFKKNDLPYFRTCHSIAFMSLGITRDQVMQSKDYNKIGDHLGLKFSNNIESSEPVLGGNPGDKYSFIYGFSRARKIEPLAVWDSINHDNLNWWEFLRYKDTVDDYKKSRGLFDFADMVDTAVKPLDIDVLIIDEAQDLSTAQWQYIYRVFFKAKRVYIGGDDDQAIFEWSGADVGHFINLKGNKTILNKSHRIPATVHDLAKSISDRISNRTDKDYTAKSEKGNVEYWGDLEHIDMSSGTWLLMSRNTYLLGELVASTREKGYNYLYRGKNSISSTHIGMIKLWEQKRKGKELTEDEKDKLSEYTSNVRSSLIWHEAFDKMDTDLIEYYVSLLRRGESLTKTPRIKISTIHGSKGGEADNVILLTDMAYSTWEASSMNSDSEHRVWYVGATRAKQSLNIVMPRGKYFYQI